MSQYDYLRNLSINATIEVESTNTVYKTVDDWGMVIANSVYVSAPELNTAYIEVPGLNGLIDLSEAITGRPTFKKRTLKVVLKRIHDRKSWDSIISDLRNKIHGRVVKISFSNDPAYYWYGRIYVSNFTREYKRGTVELTIPECDPYKYNMESSAEPWKWDPFNFETGVITNADAEHIVGSGEVIIPSGNMYVSPEFIVSNLSSSSFAVEFGGKTYELKLGSTRIPPILINGDEEVTLKFTGTADVLIVYRGGSL